VKTGHSAFQATTLDRVLANLGVDTCVCAVGGFLDDLVQTIAEGSALRYEMVVPVDAVDASRREHQRMWRHRSTVTTSAEAIEELAASAASRRPKAPGGAALLVIDLQNDFLHPEGVRGRLGYSLLTEGERGSIIEKNQALCQAARAAGRPVIFARVGARKDNLDRAWAQAIRRELPIADDENYLLEGSWGAEVVEGVDVDDNDFQVTKKGNSAFGFTPLHRILRNLNVTTCIVSGGAVHGCIEATVREGVGLGYSFVVVPDAAYPPGSLIPEVLGTQAEFMNTEEAIARLRPVQ
jgi:ureidoacrylate peracid hydrolase